MSHRGGNVGTIENTLPAFRNSAALSVDLLELDVQETKDGQVVIFHDSSLKRMTGIDAKIQDLNYKDLPLLKHKSLDDARIPLLSELLLEFPSYPMQIDLKNGSDSLVKSTFELLKDRTKLTLWGSFNYSTYHRILKFNDSRIPMFFPMHRALGSLLLYHVGLLGWMNIHEAAIIMPNVSIFLNKGYIDALHDRGISVLIFGDVNSFEKFHKLKSLEVDGACTDDPKLLKEWTESKSK